VEEEGEMPARGVEDKGAASRGVKDRRRHGESRTDGVAGGFLGGVAVGWVLVGGGGLGEGEDRV
jgi:hypothetical protein